MLAVHLSHRYLIWSNSLARLLSRGTDQVDDDAISSLLFSWKTSLVMYY